MKLYIKHVLLVYCVSLIILAGCLQYATAQQGGSPFIGTWGVGLVAQNTTGSALTFSQQTVRQVLYTSVGGDTARVHLSNVFGTAPVVISNVHIALTGPGTSVNPSSDRVITFNGSLSVTIPPGTATTSDTIGFVVPALTSVSISMYFPSTTPIVDVTTHPFSVQGTFYAPGNQSSQTSLSSGNNAGTNYYFLSGLDVQNPTVPGSIIAFGASITNGDKSTLSANHRWPTFLSQRFAAAGMSIGMLNEGISGNKLLTDNGIFGVSGVSRFNRDVLSQPGGRWVIISDLPINDLGGNSAIPATQFISAIQSLITQAHQQQFKIFCSTLTPYGNNPSWNAASEATREEINDFVRSSSSNCDGVIDQAAAIQDPNNTEVILSTFDSGDGLHPNDAGYQAIANIVNLALFSEPTVLAPPQPPTKCSSLTMGQTLVPIQPLISCDGRFKLEIQTDGNLVMSEGTTQLWASNTSGQNVVEGVMEPTGDLVLFDPNGRSLWATNTDDHPGAHLLLQDDGNLVIYDGTTPVWSSMTCCH